MGVTLAKVVNWEEVTKQIWVALIWERGEFHSPHTPCEFFDWAPMYFSRAVPRRVGVTWPVRSRRHRRASSHYLNRYEQKRQSVQATSLVDTAESAVMNFHCSTSDQTARRSLRRSPCRT
jgi:hypothetical protein